MKRINFSAFKYWPHVITLCLIGLTFLAYRYFAYYDTRSNDAYVSAPVINITSIVSGTVTKIYVSDNEKVQKGQKLLEIDHRPYRYAMQKAKASFEQVSQKYPSNSYDVVSAKADYDEAFYRYQQTTILAPEDGYITNFKIYEGQYINANEGLFALIDTKHWWVVTRYRETEIRLIKPGDKAKIKLDMYPGKVFYGHVKSIGWGINRVQAGNVVPSTLPYLEATENWIQIAQRFPVIIDFDEIDPEYPLRVGASATTITYR